MSRRSIGLTGPGAVLLISMAALWMVAACHNSKPRPQSELYSDGYQALHRGELGTAQELAREGQGRSEPGDGWWQAFRVLEAETLAGRRRDSEALDLLRDLPAAEPTGGDLRVRTRALMTSGLLTCRAGGKEAFGKGSEMLEEAAELAQGLGSIELRGEVDLRRGTCLFVHRQVKQAASFFRRALDAAQRAESRFLESHAAGSLGLVNIDQGRFDEASEWLQRALSTAEAIGAEISAAKTISNLGWCYLMLGNQERALSLLTGAELATRKLGLVGDRLTTLNNMGRATFELGRLEQAKAYYSEALALTESVAARPAQARVLSNMALVASKEGRLDDAEELLRRAMALKDELGDEAGKLHSTLAQSQILAARGQLQEAEILRRQVIAAPETRPELLWQAHGVLAQLYAESGRLAEAEVEVMKALELVNASGSRIRRVDHRLTFFSDLKELYDVAVAVQIDAGRPDRGLELAAASRARLIRELLGHVGTVPSSPVEDLIAAASETSSVLLCYWTTAQRSFVWLVHGNGIELRTLPAAGRLRSMIDRYQSLILQSGDPLVEAEELGTELWRLLVAPVHPWIPGDSRVVIAADGPLHSLSFESLIVPGDVPEEGPRYWIEDVTLARTPSLSLLTPWSKSDHRLRATEQPSPEAEILLIGDPVPAPPDFPRLAHAGPEIRAIAELFGDGGKVVTGAAAEPAAFRLSRPERFTYVHFAAHVTTHREMPLESAIVLSGPQPEVGVPGGHKLYAREVIKVPLKARLVTLSACRSAGAKALAGEGLVGLAWAFMSAGAENVIGGLWDVEDASTSKVMEHLYRGLKRDLPPAQALRLAKLRLLRSESAYRKPFYWAPFVMFQGPPRQHPVDESAKEPS